ncbi:MAG: hypothetical protein HYZ37_11080 [Candidatus Solibacter usitatus]|nr:hypothetical protein [Candidatus Solibacter usitatus]
MNATGRPEFRTAGFLCAFLLAAGSLTAQSTNCASKPLDLSAGFDGNLTTDCKMQDVVNAATAATLPASFRGLSAQSFQAVIPEGGSLLQVKLSSASFTPLVVLLDGKGNPLTSNLGTPIAPADSTVGLPAGPSTIIVASASNAAGAFSLTPALQTPRPCAPIDLTLGNQITGRLSDGGCRQLDFKGPSGNARLVDVYKVSVSNFAIAAIEMDSTAFDSYLYVLDSTGAQVLFDDNTAGRGNALIVAGLPAGDYLVVATAAASGAGAYTLQTQTQAARPCYEETISIPGSVKSALSNKDCGFLEYVPYQSFGGYTRAYNFEITKKVQVIADLLSQDFDAYLLLLDDKKTVLSEDDDSAGGSNSRIFVTLNPGRYTIVANSYDEGETGNFELRTSMQDVPECPSDVLKPGTPATGSIGTSDCRVRDFTVNQTAAAQARQFTLDIPNDGLLILEAASTQFAPGVFLASTTGKVLASNGNSANGVYQLAVAAPAGSYIVGVYSGNGRTGTFNLNATVQ